MRNEKEKGMKLKQGLVVMLLTAALSTTAWASPHAGTKFGRGLSNTAFGWFEIINEIGHESDSHGPWIGLPAGVLGGTILALGRTFSGIFEILTFPWPNGKKGYEAVLLPESVFQRR